MSGSWINIKTGDSIKVGEFIGGLTSPFKLISNTKYVIQFKFVNRVSAINDINLRIVDEDNNSVIKSFNIKVNECEIVNVVDGANERLAICELQHTKSINNARLLIGRALISTDKVNTNIISFREVQSEKSDIITSYKDNTSDDVVYFTDINTKIEQLADSITFKASKSEINGILDRVEKTEMKLTPDGLSVLITDSGGVNLLKNSLFKNDFNNWVYTNDTNIKKTTNGVQIIGNLATTYRIYQKIDYRGSSRSISVSGEFGVVDYIAGTTNTMTGIYIETIFKDDTTNNKWLIKINNTTGYNWKYISESISYDKDIKSITFYFYGRDFKGSIWARNLMVNDSKFPVKWSPNAGELYEGVTTIDSDGIRVEHSESDSYTRLDSEGLKTYNLKGKQLASFGENNTAIIDTLISNNIKNNQFLHVANKETVNIYITPDGAGKMDGSNYSNACCGIAEGIERAKILLGCGSARYGGNIVLNFTDIYLNIGSGTYYEDLAVRNIFGHGSVNFNFNSVSILRGTIKILSCQAPIYLTGGKTLAQNNGLLIKPRTDQAFNIKNSNYVNIKNVRLRSEKIEEAAIYITQNSSLYIENIDVYQFQSCVYASDNSTIAMYNCSGSGQTFGCNLKRGSKCSYEGIAFAESFIKDSASYYTSLSNTAANSVQGSSSGSEPTNKIMNKYFSIERYVSYRDNTSQENVLTQGSWTYGEWQGYCYFNAEVKEWLANATGIECQIKLSRQNTSHGISGTAEVWIDGKYRLGTLTKGESKWFVVPSAIVNELKNGRGNIIFRTTNKNNYIKFNLDASLWLKATKPTN